MRHQKSLGCAAVFLVIIAAHSMASAQDSSGSFDQLRSQVAVGDKVIVTDTAGRQVHGRIAELSAESIALMVDKKRVELAQADVLKVGRRDSRWNGTLLGLAAGAVFGALLEDSLAKEYGRDDVGNGSVILPLAVVGAGIGFSVDALIRGQRVIYSRPRTSAAGVTIGPVWNAGQKGVAVSLRF